MIRTIAILVLLAATAADAQLTTTVKRIRLEHATAAELAGTTLNLGHAVFNEENLADLRIGDGETPGGIRVGSDWWTNNMLSAWGGLSRVDVEALVALSIPYAGRVNDAESSRIRLIPSPLSASGTVTFAASTTNLFVRPDGGTNTVSFDGSGSMIVAVDGTAAMTISTNGKVGIGLSPDSAFAVNVQSLKSSSSIQGSRFQDASSITYMVDPYGDSKLLNLVLEGTLKASGLPTATNGLASGTVWSDGGTLKVMP